MLAKSMPVKKVVPPVVVGERPATTKIAKPSGPLVLMAGFLTKRNRRLNRWRQRWWKLMDNGMLLYYSSDDCSKQLGQIDIARSCYEVKFGSENCRVTFPRVAPSCCCFSFTVLKRSYYLYAPTAAEAKKWAEVIGSTSKVLNRMVVAGVQRRKAPAPPGPVRPPSCPPNMRINRNSVSKHTFSMSQSLDDSVELSLELSRTRPRLAAQRKMASSVPDYLDRVGLYSPSSTEGACAGNPNDRLWLDGSPQQVPTSTFGQTFPSPRESYSEAILSSTESQELILEVSPMSSPTSQASSGKSAVYFQVEQGATITQEQHNCGNLELNAPARRNSESNASIRTRAGKRASRYALKNRCSLPIIFEGDESVKNTQYQRSISCVPNPLSGSFVSAKSQIKPRTASLTRVPVFPRMVMGDLQKRLINDNLASNKETQPKPLPRYRARAQSMDNHLDNSRPVPKPRKSKGAMIDQTQPTTIERTMSCDFISSKADNSTTLVAASRILQVASPTGSNRSVSVTTSKILTTGTARTTSAPSITPRRKAPRPPTTKADPSPPPRPKRDSGPPTFVPPPPPIEEMEENTQM